MGAFGCVNNTIRLVSGHYLDLANPMPDQFEIDDIAGGLSRICRFGGQCPQFYSVAEHSIVCAEIALRDGLPREAVEAALMHDASEAFVGDVVKPLKIMMPEYDRIEARILKVIGERYDIDFERWRSQVKQIDRDVLIAERNLLWPADGVQWTGESEVRAIDIRERVITNGLSAGRSSLPEYGYSPQIAEAVFLEWIQIVVR